MRSVDTNVLVRLIVRDDAARVAKAQNFVQGGVWASCVVILEMAWVLESVYEFTSAQIADALEMLLQNPALAIQDADVIADALARFRAKPRVGFSDHLVLATARKAGHLPLGTFDRDLGKLDGAQKL